MREPFFNFLTMAGFPKFIHSRIPGGIQPIGLQQQALSLDPFIKAIEFNKLLKQKKQKAAAKVDPPEEPMGREGAVNQFHRNKNFVIAAKNKMYGDYGSLATLQPGWKDITNFANKALSQQEYNTIEQETKKLEEYETYLHKHPGSTSLYHLDRFQATGGMETLTNAELRAQQRYGQSLSMQGAEPGLTSYDPLLSTAPSVATMKDALEEVHKSLGPGNDQWNDYYVDEDGKMKPTVRSAIVAHVVGGSGGILTTKISERTDREALNVARNALMSRSGGNPDISDPMVAGFLQAFLQNTEGGSRISRWVVEDGKFKTDEKGNKIQEDINLRNEDGSLNNTFWKEYKDFVSDVIDYDTEKRITQSYDASKSFKADSEHAAKKGAMSDSILTAWNAATSVIANENFKRKNEGIVSVLDPEEAKKTRDFFRSIGVSDVTSDKLFKKVIYNNEKNEDTEGIIYDEKVLGMDKDPITGAEVDQSATYKGKWVRNPNTGEMEQEDTPYGNIFTESQQIIDNAAYGNTEWQVALNPTSSQMATQAHLGSPQVEWLKENIYNEIGGSYSPTLGFMDKNGNPINTMDQQFLVEEWKKQKTVELGLKKEEMLARRGMTMKNAQTPTIMITEDMRINNPHEIQKEFDAQIGTNFQNAFRGGIIDFGGTNITTGGFPGTITDIGGAMNLTMQPRAWNFNKVKMNDENGDPMMDPETGLQVEKYMFTTIAGMPASTGDYSDAAGDGTFRLHNIESLRALNAWQAANPNHVNASANTSGMYTLPYTLEISSDKDFKKLMATFANKRHFVPKYGYKSEITDDYTDRFNKALGASKDIDWNTYSIGKILEERFSQNFWTNDYLKEVAAGTMTKKEYKEIVGISVEESKELLSYTEQPENEGLPIEAVVKNYLDGMYLKQNIDVSDLKANAIKEPIGKHLDDFGGDLSEFIKKLNDEGSDGLLSNFNPDALDRLNFTISPDGKRLSYTVNPNVTPNIHAIDLSNSAKQRIFQAQVDYGINTANASATKSKGGIGTTIKQGDKQALKYIRQKKGLAPISTSNSSSASPTGATGGQRK